MDSGELKLCDPIRLAMHNLLMVLCPIQLSLWAERVQLHRKSLKINTVLFRGYLFPNSPFFASRHWEMLAGE
jgi:uncharacterized membrane protein